MLWNFLENNTKTTMDFIDYCIYCHMKFYVTMVTFLMTLLTKKSSQIILFLRQKADMPTSKHMR